MLLIEAATISGGGGYGLLKLLIEGLIERSVPFRIIVRPGLELNMVPEEQLYRKKINIWNRKKKIGECMDDCKSTILLCFSNFPPPAKYLDVRTFTYFHRVGLIEQKNTGSNTLFRRVKYNAMAKYLQLLLPNTDLVICQSDEVAGQFLNRFDYNADRLVCLPFYDEVLINKIASEKSSIEKKNQFIYVSDGAPHKNHKRLFEGWAMLARDGIYPKLLLTLPQQNDYLIEIENVRNAGGNIVLLGFLPYKELLELVAECRYAIYPSLQESLGLGLVEAALLRVTVLAADLPYTFKVVKPSETFDPFHAASIKVAVQALLVNNQPASTEVVLDNRLSEFIDLLVS